MSDDLRLDALAVGAHPDDVEFVCGGTLMKLGSMGYRVGILDMARGEMGTRGSAEIRASEAAHAAKILGLSVRDNAELPDGRIWLNEESRIRLVRKFRLYRPRILFTHYWDDPHPDHAHTCQIVREAAHHAGLARYDAENGQERFRPQSIAHFMFPRTVTPSFVVDITQFAEQKLEAAMAYRSQIFDPNSMELETNVSAEAFLRRLEARHRFYGSLIGAEHGEGFIVKETLNVDDPVKLLSQKMNSYL